MRDNLKIVVIICARGGSKGLPGKNIKQLSGKPMIAYAIDEANKSKYINKVILSTDSEEIAHVCKVYGGIEIPFMRPAELASDTSMIMDNYSYTFKRLKQEFNYIPDVIVVLQPTSPLRTVEDIDGAIEIYLEKNADSVISVMKTAVTPTRIREISPEGVLRQHGADKVILKNRQGYDTLYIHNGAVFVFKPSLLLEEKSYYSKKTFPYIMSEERSVDVDNQLDFDFAEFLLSKRNTQ